MTPVRSDLPTGTITFLFTDIEGSTKLLHQLGREAYANALAEHRRLLRAAWARHRGVEVDSEGDAFFVAFEEPGDALSAAADAQRALGAGPIRVRMGLHAGTAQVMDGGYVGTDVHLGARICASAHGGQVVLSRQTRDLLGDAPDLTDLGEHHVKDFSAPVWIYQLGAERFPPLKTISNTNLPRPVSSFVGREREVAEIGALLRDGSRLLTLTGPGGTGKTRLALEAAAEPVPDFRNGVFWVPLAALRDPALVPEIIGQTIGAKDGLAEHVGEREMLLLLDNLEQVIAAASDLASLVEACPNLRLLVTSRERMRVRGETEYAVPPLATSDAVRLFGERAGLSADQTILELCRRLDDLPLAVELAAARTTVLTPALILERLSKRLDMLKGGRDAEARQQTLRATIAWSHELLSPEEQTLFARLSIFRGGFTLEAAEQVADADLDVLSSVVDKSLLRKTDRRFAMLETIREFAAERLEDSGKAAAMLARHLGYFLALAEEAAMQDLRWSPGDWLDRLEAEHDNFRAALDHVDAVGDTESRIRLVAALWRFWQLRGHRVEGRARIEAALEADQRPSAARARALNGAAVMAVEGGDGSAGMQRAEESLELHRRFGDARGEAFSLFMLAQAATELGDRTAEIQHWQQSIRAFEAVGDANYALLAATNLAFTYEDLGELDRAKVMHEDLLRRSRAVGSTENEAQALSSLAQHALREGRMQDAIDGLKDSLRVTQKLGNDLEMAMRLRSFALALGPTGATETATILLARSEAMREELGFERSWFGTLTNEELEHVRGELDEASFGGTWARGRKMTVDEAVGLALASTVETT